MAFNTVGSAPCPLSVFGGLVTEMAPPDLPEGVSPDCADVVFAPGNVSSRPGCQKIFTTAPVAPLTGGKSFINPDPLQTPGNIQNLYLDSAGNLWKENVSSPGTLILISGGFTKNSYLKAVTAFNREYLAISDGLHGSDIPLQWDGQFLDRVTQDGCAGTLTVTSFISPGAGATVNGISRTGNTIAVQTVQDHDLQAGFQVLLADIPVSTVGGSLVSIVIDNEQLPGQATVTTASAHGLAPDNFVRISGVQAVIGPSITTLYRHSDVVTIVTGAPHGLSVGASITLTACPDASFDASYFITQIPGPNTIVMIGVAADATVASPGATVLQINWPLPDTGVLPDYFQVIETPTPTTFTVTLNYADGGWNTGTVTYSWNGLFFVESVIDSNNYTIQSYGPPLSSSSGTSTPWGQTSPGKHQCQCLFLTRNGYTTAPGPPVTFDAPGGQYLRIANIPLGPPNVIARILAFTGAEGADFFYIPVPAQINGQLVSTATQINDNSTTSVLADFSDNTLFAGLSISIPGNTLQQQIVLDGALGFGYYASRLITWGQRNHIQNLLNMGFDGGYLVLTQPLGWDSTSNAGGILGPGHFGFAWIVTLNALVDQGILRQPFYQDGYGNPIATPNTYYTFRAWFQLSSAVTDARFSATIYSISTGFSSIASFLIPSACTYGQFIQVNFNRPMPPTIPSDMTLELGIAATSSVGPMLTIDEMSIIYTENPFSDTELQGSYANNPEAFDGVTGVFGSTDDTQKVMGLAEIRDSLYVLTQDPGGRVHETQDNGTTEPSGWNFRQIDTNCGLISAFALTVSQADSATGSGGEQWISWASATGARIFSGSQAWKISQEIEPEWRGAAAAGALQWSAAPGLNPSAYTTAWTLNDYGARVIYFGLAMGSASAPSTILVMNYRELDTAEQIASSPPIRTSYTGRLIATDHTRKWTRWNLMITGSAMMYRAPGNLQPVFWASNAFTLNAAKLTDDIFGTIRPYYVTYGFVTHDQEQMLTCQDASGEKVPLGSGRKLLAYLKAFIAGVGNITITPLPDTLIPRIGPPPSPWPLVGVRTMNTNPGFDLEWGGGQAQGDRLFMKFASSPLTGTDNSFSLQRLTAFLKRAQRLQVRGAN